VCYNRAVLCLGGKRVHVACLDLEGVLVPEIWVGLAERTGIEALRATTREVPDYDRLMAGRLALLDEHAIGVHDLEAVVASLDPFDGARAFLDWLRQRCEVAIVSDTFYELARPLIAKLGHPMLLCHTLEVDAGGRITAYRLRQREPKRRAVEAFQALKFRVVAVGDSYNDTAMLAQADAGILFRPPEAVARELPAIEVCRDHDELRAAVGAVLAAEDLGVAQARTGTL
jgi:phosphoserine/homoserine phosphotransferase